MNHVSHWLRLRVVSHMPPRFQEGKTPYAVLFALLMIVVMLLFALTSPYEYGRIVPLVAAVVLAMQIVLVYYGMSLQKAVHVATVLGAIQIVFGAWVSGGIFSPRLAWLFVLPITPFFVFGRRSGLIWLYIVLAIQLAVAAVSLDNRWIEPFAIGLEHTRASLTTYVLVTLVILIVPIIYDTQHRKALQQVRMRQQELEKKREELQNTLLARDQFISIVSHELRTPMNAILGFNSLLLEQAHNRPRAKSILEHTRQSADHLMTVINDVLDFSQFESGSLLARHENFDLRQTVQAAFDLFGHRVKSAGLEYRLECDPAVPQWVSTDRHRLMQILVNLLGNAIKFTHTGEVVLRVQWKSSGVFFSVSDTGIGIALEQQGFIFQRFNQAGSDTQKRYGGNGLGLSITQRLVHLLDGQIGFESVHGSGSRFWVALPLEAVDAEAPALHPVPTAGQTPEALRFLVVDDHPINRLLVTQVLRKYWPAATVLEADSGVKALSLLHKEVVDLVLMDMVMPLMDGIEATQAIRSQLPAPANAVPILGLTANVNPNDLARFEAAGLQGVMLKPFEPQAFCTYVRALLAVSHHKE